MLNTVMLDLETGDPVDLVSRLLAIVQRCSIELETLAVDMCREAGDVGGFKVRCRMRSVPFPAEHLADRIRQIPCVRAVRATADVAIGGRRLGATRPRLERSAIL
jgi:hypothetical protein